MTAKQLTTSDIRNVCSSCSKLAFSMQQPATAAPPNRPHMQQQLPSCFPLHASPACQAACAQLVVPRWHTFNDRILLPFITQDCQQQTPEERTAVRGGPSGSVAVHCCDPTQLLPLLPVLTAPQSVSSALTCSRVCHAAPAPPHLQQHQQQDRHKATE